MHVSLANAEDCATLFHLPGCIPSLFSSPGCHVDDNGCNNWRMTNDLERVRGRGVAVKRESEREVGVNQRLEGVYKRTMFKHMSVSNVLYS